MKQTITTNSINYYHPKNQESLSLFADRLSHYLTEAITMRRPVVFLCIGSDRATGDALGPFIGQQLLEGDRQDIKKEEPVRSSHSLFHAFWMPWKTPPKGDSLVFGTLHRPVHAVNLAQTISHIYSQLKNPYLVAIDAALGARNHIGAVTLASGSLLPGIGVNKQLPSVGDVHITGIVNTLDCDNRNRILQTTHLSTVVDISTFVSQGILQALSDCSITYPSAPPMPGIE
ncbi:MAG: spore protease YyaC [Lachnospiraceae bacterium]|nr:spore protease YyaC [Lachnospiraceae bacterium]